MMEFVQDDMVDRHPERAILPGVNWNPPIGKLGNLIEIGRKDHQLGPVVTRFCGEMNIGCARHAHVRSDRSNELRIEPVRAFGYIRLLTPRLGAGGRQVAVPIIKTHAHAAQQLHEAARNNYRNAIATMDYQKKNMELAEKIYQQTKKKYEVGTGSQIEIVAAQTEMKSAQTNYVSALYDAIIAKVDYLKATGKL